MTTPKIDERSPERRARDEQIAAEPQMPPLELPPDAPATPVETRLDRNSHPVAVVENGLVRPLDPAVKLSGASRHRGSIMGRLGGRRVEVASEACERDRQRAQLDFPKASRSCWQATETGPSLSEPLEKSNYLGKSPRSRGKTIGHCPQ